MHCKKESGISCSILLIYDTNWSDLSLTFSFFLLLMVSYEELSQWQVIRENDKVTNSAARLKHFKNYYKIVQYEAQALLITAHLQVTQ